MKKNNRYEFIKEMYPNYVLFLKKKNKYQTYFIDKKICLMLKIKRSKYLQKYKINYLIIDNLEIIYKYESKTNKYNKYIISYLIKELMERIKENEEENNNFINNWVSRI